MTRILIFAEPEVGRAWAEQLRGPTTRVWLGRSEIPAGERPDLIVANCHIPAVTARDEVGVVLVGGEHTSAGALAADVRLPASCTADELCRACQLLGEVVRLRRREREAADVHRELAQAAMTDPLTGLANRRAWDQELVRRIATADESKGLCLAVLDLDRFKQVNDTQGHVCGDRLLQIAGRALKESLRRDDFVARLGGDEFGLLLWTTAEAAAGAVVERVRRQIAAAAAEGGLPAITASAGFAVSKSAEPSIDAEALFIAADSLLMEAKRNGRDRTVSPLSSQ